MVEMAAKQTIVEEIVLNAYFKILPDGISNNRSNPAWPARSVRLDSRGKMILVSEQLLFWIGLGIGLACIVAWALLSRRRAAEDRRRDKFLEVRLSGAAEVPSETVNQLSSGLA